MQTRQGRNPGQEPARWHYRDSRQRQLGPYPAEAIVRLFQFGHVRPETPVWRDDPAAARPLRECRDSFRIGGDGRIQALAPVPEAPTAPPPTPPPAAPAASVDDGSPPPASAPEARPIPAVPEVPPVRKPELEPEAPALAPPEPARAPAVPVSPPPRPWWHRGPALLALFVLLVAIAVALRLAI